MGRAKFRVFFQIHIVSCNSLNKSVKPVGISGVSCFVHISLVSVSIQENLDQGKRAENWLVQQMLF